MEAEQIYFHTPGRLASAFPYTAMVAGIGIAHSGAELTRKRFHHHVLILTLAGQGVIEVQGHRFAATRGTLAWLDTSMQYAHGCPPGAPDWHYLWIGIQGHGLGEVFDFLRVRSAPIFAIGNLAETEAGFARVIEHLRQRTAAVPADSAMIGTLIADLVAARQDEPGNSQAIDDEAGRIAAVIAEVRAGLQRAWTIEEMAAISRLSGSQFHRQFKAKVGTSPMDWLRHERVNLAKRHLIEPQAKIATVALACGYPDPYHFSRDFRRVTGFTPTQFRLGGGY